ncbi:protein EARLY-RESPONSIVE TO DEHYDRATION 7, chloroplastic isoform X1 [Elaeis guineensis]|uniref:Protein EARLY-RESPONSIVE TO DEHYDRATION 7, chloroplastic isoform X1 n=1 Tax=Elaeis guineensis var. tenera TaxID=51953 RepID=A0A8N4EVZ7_ELAGV|nr:protein EARLY-RESPONSIVE TO DEHYDRATION 7, chloroplastic isoform X1 [Elaeis guineensis]
MATQERTSSNFRDSKSLYPQVLESNPESDSPFLSHPNNPSRSPLYPSLDDSPPPPRNPNANPSSSLYPSIEMKELVENLFPDADDDDPKSPAAAPTLPPPVEETLLRIPGAILHLIDKQRSVELGVGDFTVVRLRQGENTVAVLARVGHDLVQWPLARDEAAVKLDDCHYFFSLHVPKSAAAAADDDGGGDGSEDLLNYGLTFASKGQEGLLKELDRILESYSSFSVQKVEGKAKSEVLDGSVAKEVTPAEVMGPKKEMMEERSAAYWTTLAPNVEDYSGSVAKVIAKGSGQLIRGILWCGDVTVDRLKWGEDLLKRRMVPGSKQTEISKDALKRIKRVKGVTKMSEKVATGILSGVVKVSGFFTSSVVNSKAGKKFFSLLPGEIVLASLDGFEKICDAVEVAGKNVLQTSSVVTTGVVSHRYGDQAAEVTNEGLDAAGHAIGTAWAVFKIRKALNPKSAVKPTSLAKSAVKAAAADLKAKKGK